MEKNRIKELIYKKYIEPTKTDRSRSIGIEIEMPIVNMKGEPVDEQISLNVAEKFRAQFDFKPVGCDDDNNVNSMTNEESGDNLSFDCSYSNLELSLGKGTDLFEIKKRFYTYYKWLKEAFSEYGYMLTGMGINPHYNINHNQPVPNERYRMLFHHLHSYPQYSEKTDLKFTDRADFGTFTNASQVQIDVYYDELIDTINTFGLLEPYKALLFSNSYMEEYPSQMCARNMLWERSMQGYNPHNIGMFSHKLKDTDELIEYIMSTSIYCTMRNGKYVNFKPVPIAEYFQADIIKGEFYNGTEYQPIEITPCEEDIVHLRSFKFEDLTFRGTIEYRSTCCQPVRDSMTLSAFHIGLTEMLYELKAVLENDDVIYGHGYDATELQKLLSQRDIPTFIDETELKKQLKTILDIASEGLKKRQYGEEKFLEPLYRRAEKLTNPAKEMIDGIEKGKTLNDFIYDYSSII